MESLIAHAVVQGGAVSPGMWGCLASSWHWFFWLGFFGGIIGGAVCFFLKPVEGM